MIFSSPDPAADPYFAGALLRLQRSSYALEAQLIGDDRIPPLKEDAGALAAWRGHWRTAWDGINLVGAIAWWENAERIDINKVMVSPSAVRHGIASALLSHVLEGAQKREVVASTGRDNAPATTLYAKHGFRRDGDEEVPPGIWITRFRLAPSSRAQA